MPPELHSIEDIEALAETIIEELDLDYRVKIDVTTQHSKRLIGRAHLLDGRIRLYHRQLKDWDVTAIEDVIRHELAHLAEYWEHKTSGHGKRWKAIAVEFGALPLHTSEHDERVLYAKTRNVAVATAARRGL